MKRRRLRLATGLLALVLLGGASLFVPAALADPSHNVLPPQPLTCDNNTSVIVNPGTLTNQSHEGFVIGSPSIFVIKYLAFTDATGTLVLFDTAPGLTPQGLVTCTGDAGGGFIITARGFFTPRA
ncbi:MAG TPA: hypothetical protein VIZ44_12190 [Gaiellaceae bacterium]